jgi:hypothetical protein
MPMDKHYDAKESLENEGMLPPKDHDLTNTRAQPRETDDMSKEVQSELGSDMYPLW